MGSPLFRQAPRQPVGGGDSEALSRLLGMGGPSNVGGLTNRGLDVVTGMDTFAPSDQELMDEQMSRIDSTPLDRTTGRPKPFAVASRESLRDEGMSKVRAFLGMQDIKHQQQMQTEQAKSASAMEKFLLQQQGLNDRAAAGRDAQVAGMEARLAAAEKAREDQQAFAATQQAERLAAQHGGSRQATIPAQMDKSLSDARSGYGGVVSTLARKLHMDGGAQKYEGALTSVLQRLGTLGEMQQAVQYAKANGKTAGDMMAEAQANGDTVHPYEQEYLRLKLGD